MYSFIKTFCYIPCLFYVLWQNSFIFQSSWYSLLKSLQDYPRIQFERIHFLHIDCCSVTQSCPTLHDPMDCSMPDFPVLCHLLEFVQTRVHWVSDAIQPSHPLSSPSPPAFNLFQHQGLFQWISSSHQVAKVLELELQHKAFQWIFRIDFL